MVVGTKISELTEFSGEFTTIAPFVPIEYSGSNYKYDLRNLTSNIITDDLTINVPTDYATLQAAMEYLYEKIINPGVLVQINIASGTYLHTDAIYGHPQSNQITVTGSTMTFPVAADFVITGNDSSARATDNANHLTMLKSKYGVEIQCDNCQAIDSRYGLGVPELNNLLFWTDNTNDVCVYLYDYVARMNKVSFHGWGGIGLALTHSGDIRTGDISISGMGNQGMQASDKAEMKSVDTFISCSNGNSGVFVKRGGTVELGGADVYIAGNASDGVLIQDEGIIEVSGGVVEKNGFTGLMVENGGNLTAANVTSKLNGDFGFAVNNSGIMNSASCIAENNGESGWFADGVGLVYCSSSRSDDNGGAGFQADHGAKIFGDNTTADGNATHGYWARYGAQISAFNASSTNNTGSGVRSEGLGSLIDVRSGDASGNTVDGLYALQGGHINGGSFASTGNTTNGVYVEEGNSFIYFQSGVCTGNGGRGVYSANVVFGGIDAENATINTNTGNQVEVAGTAGCIRYLNATITGNIAGYQDTINSMVFPTRNNFMYANYGASSTLTISSGSVTATRPIHAIDTEAAAASDDLDTINGGTAGQMLILCSADTTHDVVIKHGTGNIRCGSDRTLTHGGDKAIFIKDLSNSFWDLLSFSDNAS